MIRHPGIFGRLHAAAGRGSVTGWTPAGLPTPKDAEAVRADEAEPERQPWMYEHDWERFKRHWRERQQAEGTV